MVQLAQFALKRLWVVDVDIYEYTKKKINFKESPDGSGILIKGRKFSLNDTGNMMAESCQEVTSAPGLPAPPTINIAPQRQTTEIMIPEADQRPQKAGTQNLAQAPVDPKRVLYWVVYEPYVNEAEAKQKKLRFSPNRKYPVHRTRTSTTGVGMELFVTDDLKRVVAVDEKFFSNAGAGLVGDNEVDGGFSTSRAQGPKLMYENELVIDPEIARQAVRLPKDIPVGDGGVPADLFKMPDLRPGKRL